MGFLMKYPIKKQYLTSNSERRSGIKMPHVGFMVAHDTGNPNSTAAGNVGYYERSRNEASASAHIFVDDKEIIECIPFLTATPEKAWHVIYNVTTDNQMYGDDANDIAGGVELCFGSKINAEEAYKRYIWVLAYSCYKFNLNPAKAIVGHMILDPRRKVDPGNGLKQMGNSYSYSKLLADVVKEYNACLGKTVAAATTPASGSTYTIKEGDTFWGLAQHSNGAFTAQDLISWNPTINPATLKAGQKINLKKPTAAAAAKDESKKAPAASKEKKWDLPVGTMGLGGKGENCYKIQLALCAANFYPDRSAPNNGCDRVYGAKTVNAMKRFQSMYVAGKADGVYGPETKAALEKLLNK